MSPMARSKRATASQKRAKRGESEPEDEGYETSSADDDIQALDSDNMDDEDKADTAKRGKKEGAKRKKIVGVTKPKKRRKKVKSDEDESDPGLKDGQEVVGKIVRAPKTGQGEVASVPRERINLNNRFLSSPRTNISEHFPLSQSTESTRVQRSGMVSSRRSDPLIPLTIDNDSCRFKLNGVHALAVFLIPKSDPDPFRTRLPASGERMEGVYRSVHGPHR
jgi:hypothetical protein